MSRKTIERIRKVATSTTYKEAQKKKNQEWFDASTVDYHLGTYVGEHIVDRYLPTLSIDVMQSRTVLQVSEEDAAQNKTLEEAWAMDMDTPANWEAYHTHSKELQKKYMPAVLECPLPLTKFNDEAEFKAGLRNALWECDICSYDISPENIKIEHDMERAITRIFLTHSTEIE
jgi:hypothetical protein